MNIVKEYNNGKTKVRIHDDYINPNDNSINKIIIAIMLNELNLNENYYCNHL